MYQAKKIIKPPYLKAGDKVALVSPAYWMPEEAILQAAEIIRSWGLHPVIGPHTTSLEVDAYSGTADERAADMLWALEDDSIKAIVCTRGGYGSIHLQKASSLEAICQVMQLSRVPNITTPKNRTSFSLSSLFADDACEDATRLNAQATGREEGLSMLDSTDSCNGDVSLCYTSNNKLLPIALRQVDVPLVPAFTNG